MKTARAVATTCVALLLDAPGIGWGQIYAGAESGGGAIVLSNFRTDDVSVLVVEDEGARAGEGRRGRQGTGHPSPELRVLVDGIARQTLVSPELLLAVIYTESRFDSAAVSPRGAIGLMQLLPETGRRFGARDLFADAENIRAGASYLKWLMSIFDNDLELVLAAYNAGEQAVLHAGRRIPPYPETRAYVRNVLARLQLPLQSQ